MLQFYVPEVVAVEQIFDEADKVEFSDWTYVRDVPSPGGSWRAQQTGRQDWTEGPGGREGWPLKHMGCLLEGC